MNFQELIRASVPTNHMSRNFDFSYLKSGQISDLSIINLWGNMKMLPVSHKLTKATQFIQDHDHSPHLWWSGCNWWSGVAERSSEITWCHNPFFAHNSRQNGDRDAQMVPNDLDRQDDSEDMHIDLLGSWTDLGLAWTVLKTNFKIDLSRSKSTCFEPARRGKHDGIIIIFRSFI